MAAPKKTISVVIPLYNGVGFIAESLSSVLNQTLPADEIIVVDDGSTDDGPALVEKMAENTKVRLLRKANGGQSSARNFGISQSSGDLIALLDQDDVWYPNHLAELSKPFAEEHYPELAWVYSDLDEIDEQGRMVRRKTLGHVPGVVHPKRDIFTCLKADMMILPSASLMSRAAFDAVGGFDERLVGFEDDDLFLRMFRAGYDNIYLETPLSKWRLYGGSTSFSKRMSLSRMIYAKKLIETFQNDPGMRRFYTHAIARRFLPWLLTEYGRALKAGDREAIRIAYDNVAALQPELSPRKRRQTNPFMLLARAPLANPKFAFLGHIARRAIKNLLA